MIDIMPFRFEHVDLIKGQPDQIFMRPSDLVHLEGNNAFSGFVEGECIGCMGVVKIWPKRYHAWAYLSSSTGPYMLEIMRRTRGFLHSLGDCRVEASVLADFEKGQRFARMVGLTLETPEPMRKYLNGKDAYLYAWVPA